MTKINFYKLNNKLNKISRYCRHCKDTYWNIGDCNSIKKDGMCLFCLKEKTEKDQEKKKAATKKTKKK